jgi:hypothetical protein
MRRSLHTQHPSKPPQSNETVRCILALAVLALFIGVCLAGCSRRRRRFSAS